MRQIWLFVVAAVLALTPAVAFAEQAMSDAPTASGKAMQEAKGGAMGMQSEDKMQTKDKKMEGKETKMEGKTGDMGMQSEDKKMEGKGAKMEDKK